MAPWGATGKGRRDSGPGEGVEGQKVRGHMPKSKRLRVDAASSENDDDFQSEEVVMVDAQGTGGSQRLGFGRDGVSRDKLATIKQVIVGGVVGASPRTNKAQGIVITEAWLQRQAAGVGEATTSGIRTPIVLVGGGGRFDKAVIGAVQPRQALPAQQARGSSAAITPPPQTKVDAGGSRTLAGDHHTSASGVAEGVVEGRVDHVRREDGKRDGRREGDDDDDRPPVHCSDYFVAIANGDAGPNHRPCSSCPRTMCHASRSMIQHSVNQLCTECASWRNW
ncbi:hypothetical protein CBR_g59144 [Chara braunii]|uniref:Uncharacterized protein n=1 Tax=Chara braunii TaxID=69332 RepID=A0A388MF62_CHABU|nr:hypothetical protein CBR_g59144 [Chara braunii]|eukprot:GBG93119.1 hypothetical protein CBR_g59144 [Chara braunii]